MKTKYILLVLTGLLVFSDSLAQSIFFDLDTLHEVQFKYRNRQIILDQYSDSLICKRLYNIPDSVILQSYPYNADSILVAIPDSCRDTHDNVYCDFDKTNRYPILSKMTKEEMLEFADNIYNYDFVGNYSIYYSSIERNNPSVFNINQYKDSINDIVLQTTSFAHKEEITLPNIILLFYHHNAINYIGLYFDDNEHQLRMATSFLCSGMLYLGEYCPDRNLRLRNFFKSRYNMEILKFKDYIPPLLPLIETSK
ncbi:hypothetical protein [Dysgonomonas sp. 25]|uniref:hypothetical protein n=1 Tax=Dysgonomonas sp. 25 TaxID=2302933 RepID=UPI0013D60DD5|nr:hypothetical protein [Dysgonomonas sp. 25]NDV67899.1 hypothetical protein [Dysgonomonas sp. 25]